MCVPVRVSGRMTIIVARLTKKLGASSKKRRNRLRRARGWRSAFGKSAAIHLHSAENSDMLPIIFFPKNLLVTVIGGGSVGRRKVAVCAEAGFAVRVVDPVRGELPGVEWVAESYRLEHLAGTALVVAAATSVVNAQVVSDARQLRVPVCDAGNPTAGDFLFPAVVRRGELLFAVSTGGGSPALARQIRDRLASDFGPEYGTWVEVLDAVRGRVLQIVPDIALRRRLLAGFAENLWLDRLREAGGEQVQKEMLAAVEAATGAV